ncbi:MAG: TIM-barrel domain-containing protein [Fimbriimonas sp.]
MTLATTPQDTIQWKQVAPGVWKGVVGRKDEPTLLSAAVAKPSLEALRELGSKGETALQPFLSSRGGVASDFASVRIPLGADEKLYGLGLQMEGSNRRGGVYHLRVDHYASGNDRLHAPVPLYVSSRGYAVLFDTSRPCSIYMGVGNRVDGHNPAARDRNTDPAWDAQPPSEVVEASVQGPGLTVYLFEGPTPMNAMQRYNLFCGGGALPPRWSLGFWHRTPSLATQAAVESEVAEFHKRGFPIDVLGLEPGWQSASYPCTFEWSKERFPNPASLVSSLSKDHVHVNLWTNPYVSEKSPIYSALTKEYGSHMVWLGPAPDLSMPAASKTIRDFFTREHLDIGVSGYKVDEIDGFDNWLWPDHATFPSGLSGIRMRQVYGLLWQRELDAMFRKSGKRTFGLVRGSNAGASRFPFAIYSDTYDLHQYITGMASTGFSGVMWCAEARDAENGEEWVRRLQTAAVSHIAQLNAWASGTKPWSYPGFDDPVKAAMLFRTRLTPYLYTAFAQYHRQGTPVIRPMALVDGGEETDQFLLGDDILVAPMEGKMKSRRVRLPKGNWYEFGSGKLVGNGTVVEIAPSLMEMPVFVRDGALLPTLSDDARNSTMSPQSRVVVRYYGSAPGAGWLYDDDGETYAFEKGDFGLHRLSLDSTGQVLARLVDGRRKLALAALSVLRVN